VGINIEFIIQVRLSLHTPKTGKAQAYRPSITDIHQDNSAQKAHMDKNVFSVLTIRFLSIEIEQIKEKREMNIHLSTT
jgi:hypothetical protein